MKCPNCGAEMQDNRLYCEKCGEDIHIVPDFEPELERNMEQSLERISEEVAQDGKGNSAGGEKKTSAPPDGEKRSRRKAMAGWIGIAVLVVILTVTGVGIFRYFSPDYQTRRARQTAEQGKYDRAVRYYTRAMELDSFNIDLKLELAEVYFLKNDKVNYEYWLREIVADPNTNGEQLESAYGKLIAIYRAREEYQAISDMLLTCQNESIRTAYRNYLAEPPQFSVAGGEYDEVQTLKLTVTGKGTIYYTLDGTRPDERSSKYTAPILLEDGNYLVRAVYVNENGVVSKIAEADYQITVEELEAPEINVDDGDYDTPVYITVTNDIEGVYYTTDGTTPTMDSAHYTEPVPMPLGVSHFKFARLEIGRSSEIVERRFVLELDTDVTPETAVDTVRNNALDTGKITDSSGHFDDTEAHYQYQYLCVVNFSEIGDSSIDSTDRSGIYYLVAEVLVDAQGFAGRTGNYYAINAYQGSCFKLQTQDGIYTLVGI